MYCIVTFCQDPGDREERGALQEAAPGFCPRDSVRPAPPPSSSSSSSVISATKLLTSKPLEELRARRSKYSTYDRRRPGMTGLPVSGKTH